MSCSRLHTLALVLLGAAALTSCARVPARVKYAVVDRPGQQQIAPPQYHVVPEAAATLVTISAGEKPSGGYSVEMTSVDRTGNTCIVRYRIKAPPPDAIVTQALTYPSTTVRIEPACPNVDVDPPLPRAQTK